MKISKGLSTSIFRGSKTKGMQIATVIFLVSSVVLIWQIAETYPKISILQDNIKAQEAEIKNSKDTLKRLEEFIGFIAKNEEIVNKFDSILPADEEKANLLSNLGSLAGNNGLSTLKIFFEESNNLTVGQQSMTSTVSKNYDFDSRTIKMTMRGSYFSFKNFLATIEKNLRIVDIVSVDFTSDVSTKDKEQAEGEKKIYLYNIELKTYLNKPSDIENISKLLGSAKYKNFTVKNLNFTKEKVFNDMFLSSGYDINIGVEEIGNSDMF